MTTRSKACMLASLFFISNAYVFSGCDEAQSTGTTSKEKEVEVYKVHLLLSDEKGNTLLDTTYESKMAPKDTLRINTANVASYTPPTGGSSRCSVQLELYKTEIDDPNNKSKSGDDDDK